MSISAQYIIVGIIFVLVVVWQVRKRILRKQGKAPQSDCGCGCSGCSGCSTYTPSEKKRENDVCNLKNSRPAK